MTNSQLDTTNESQAVSPFPAGDHKAHMNRRAQRHSKHNIEQKHKPLHELNILTTTESMEKILRSLKAFKLSSGLGYCPVYAGGSVILSLLFYVRLIILCWSLF